MHAGALPEAHGRIRLKPANLWRAFEPGGLPYVWAADSSLRIWFDRRAIAPHAIVQNAPLARRRACRNFLPPSSAVAFRARPLGIDLTIVFA